MAKFKGLGKNLSKSEIATRNKARNKLRELSKGLKSDLASGLYEGTEKATMSNYADILDNYIERTKGGKKSEVSTTSMLESVVDIQSTLNRDSDLRKEKITQRNINQASIGGVSKFSQEEVKIFYSMTQRYWEGKSIEERNQAIKEGLGVSTLDEAWEKVFGDENAQKALAVARDAQNPASSDQSESIRDGSRDEVDEKGSPQYIKYLQTLLDNG